MNRVAGVRAALEVQLTDEEAVELAVEAALGDQWARERLAHSLMGLVFSIVGAYHRQYPLVDEDELTGVGLETLLRYGIDRYNPDSGIPVRIWVALLLRRKLAKAVDKHLRELENRSRYAATAGPTQERAGMLPVDDMRADFRRLLKWARRHCRITMQQAEVMEMRGEGLLFDEIGQRLGIHRRKANREYTAALLVLEGQV